MQLKDSSTKVDETRSNRVQSVLNLFGRYAADPIMRLRRRRNRVAAQLAALIATVGLSHAKVAEKAGIKPSQLSRQLSGDTNLTLDTISRICDAVGSDYDIIFRPTEQPAVKQWWEKDGRSSEKSWTTVTALAVHADLVAQLADATSTVQKVSVNEPVASTLEQYHGKIGFSWDMEDIEGLNGRIKFCTTLAVNDESELIAA